MSDQDQELETIDIAEGDDDDQIELDVVDDANGEESNEPYEMDPTDDLAQETMLPPSKEKHKRDRSRSASRKDDEKEDFGDSELDSDVDVTEVTEDADLEEKELLSMPSVRSVMNDVDHLKTERRVIVHSLNWNELHHPALLQTAAKNSCEEIQLSFVRPKDNPDNWSGILDIHFTSTSAAKEAVEDLKTIREDISVKHDTDNDYARSFVEKWIKTEKGSKRLTDALLLIRNIPEEVTLDELRDIINDAEDLVFSKHDTRRKDDKKTRNAYAVYRSHGAATTAANNYASSSLVIGGNTLKVHKYQIPVDNLPRGLLKLFERRLILKYLEKVAERIESSNEEEKAPEWCLKRQKICLGLIERDNRCREDLGLPTPSLEELRANRGVRVLRGSKRSDLLLRLGVIELKRRQSFDHNNRNDKRRRDQGSSSNSRSLLGNPPSLLNLNMRAVPLSLLMQQSSSSYVGIGDRRSHIGAGEPSTKMLRLDSSGNFHMDFNRDNQRRRDDRGDRSRSSRSGGSGRYDRR